MVKLESETTLLEPESRLRSGKLKSGKSKENPEVVCACATATNGALNDVKIIALITNTVPIVLKVLFITKLLILIRFILPPHPKDARVIKLTSFEFFRERGYKKPKERIYVVGLSYIK
jgi:hypothetical protein